jgi:hypothetical protein
MGVTLRGKSPEVWTVSFSIAASAPAGTSATGNITRVAGQPAQPVLTVPTDELWEIKDFYITSTQTPDALIQPVVNSNIQPFQPNLNSMLISNQNKVKLDIPIILKPGSLFYINAITLAANGAGTATLTLYIQVTRHSLVSE